MRYSGRVEGECRGRASGQHGVEVRLGNRERMRARDGRQLLERERRTVFRSTQRVMVRINCVACLDPT